MTRVTAPRELSKLVRHLSTAATAPRPNRLPSNIHKTAISELWKEYGKQDASTSERKITTAHRPVAVAPNPNRVIPLMQGFHTNPPRSSPALQADPVAVDLAVLPGVADLSPASDTDSMLLSSSFSSGLPRVPLLPDNFSPSRSPDLGHAPEVPDAPLAVPEIVVLAADPERVFAVSALTEVEGMGPNGVELKFAHGSSSSSAAAAGDGEYAGGMLRSLWDGIVDDVLGGPSGKVKPVA